MSKKFLPRELFRRVLGAEVVEVRVSRFAPVQPVDVAPKMLAVAAYAATVSVRVRCREFRRTLMRALDFLRDDHHVPLPATTRVATRRVHAGVSPGYHRGIADKATSAREGVWIWDAYSAGMGEKT